MLKAIKYTLRAILPIILVFLAVSGRIWAAPAPVSSIVVRNLQRDRETVQAATRTAAAETDFFEELLSAPDTAEPANSSDSNVDLATDTETDFEAQLARQQRDSEQEFAAYEDIIDKRYELYRLAASRTRARVVSIPALPERGASLTDSNKMLAGGSAASCKLAAHDSPGRARARSSGVSAVRFADAAVNVVRRDYYSLRNGYNDRLRTFSFLKVSPAFRLRSSSFVLFPHSRVIFYPRFFIFPGEFS